MASFPNFFEEDFLSLQNFLAKLIPESVFISHNVSLPSDLNSLCHILYQQTKIYAQKILDLYETLDQNYQEEMPVEKTVFESADFQFNLSPIKIPQSHYEKAIEALTKERESLLLCLEKYKEKPIEINDTIQEYDLENKDEVIKSLESHFSKKDTFVSGCILMQNIDYEIFKEIDPKKYLNWLIISNRIKDQYTERLFENLCECNRSNQESLKHKDFFNLMKQIENFTQNNNMKESLEFSQQRDHLKGKIEYLNNEISRLNSVLQEKEKDIHSNLEEITKEKNEIIRNLEEAGAREKEVRQSLENDLSELLEEFKLMKEKFEELVHFINFRNFKKKIRRKKMKN